jgi:type IV pilus assembly protein PilA
LELRGLIARQSSPRAGRAIGGTDRGSAPFLRPFAATAVDAGASCRHHPRARRRAGFTLVEVIVVLVILAILAAIAIPALTGYIDKAQDKEYIAEARNAYLAMRAATDDLYAAGKLAPYEIYIQEGRTNTTYTNIKLWAHSFEGQTYEIYKEAAKLVGTSWDVSNKSNPGYWTLDIVGDKSSTFLNAGGFVFYLYPDGNSENSGNPAIYVTYHIAELDLTAVSGATTSNRFANAFKLNAMYEPNAGYYVYHTNQ